MWFKPFKRNGLCHWIKLFETTFDLFRIIYIYIYIYIYREYYDSNRPLFVLKLFITAAWTLKTYLYFLYFTFIVSTTIGKAFWCEMQCVLAITFGIYYFIQMSMYNNGIRTWLKTSASWFCKKQPVICIASAYTAFFVFIAFRQCYSSHRTSDWVVLWLNFMQICQICLWSWGTTVFLCACVCAFVTSLRKRNVPR